MKFRVIQMITVAAISYSMLTAEDQPAHLSAGNDEGANSFYKAGCEALAKDDYSNASSNFLRGAEAGHHACMAQLAYMYLYGIGCDRDGDKALKLLEKATEGGSDQGYYYLGCIYRDGLAGTKRDVEKAASNFVEAAKLGDKSSVICLVRIYIDGELGQPDFDNAMKWLKIGEQRNYHECLTVLGDIYQNGTGVEKDFNKAIRYYEKSIEEGSKVGRSRLAALFLYGDDSVRDFDKAFTYYKAASEAGEFAAAANFANMYYLGIGCKRDPEMAFSVLEKAIKDGDLEAANMFNRLKAMERPPEGLDR